MYLYFDTDNGALLLFSCRLSKLGGETGSSVEEEDMADGRNRGSVGGSGWVVLDSVLMNRIFQHG